jgi:hypothetical protein
MAGLLLTVLLLTQAQMGSGVISGVLRDVNNNPVANVRVALTEVSNAAHGAAPGSVLVSISQTDASGAYRLENVPPGRYFIVAGTVDRPTYYPGTMDLSKAREISVSQNVAGGLDFAVTEESRRSPASARQVTNLPLVGGNVLDLLRVLPGVQGTVNPPNQPNQPFSFALEGVRGQAVDFRRANGTAMRYECLDCYFVITAAEIASSSSNPGIAFRLKNNGQELDFTCQARECKVEATAFSPTRLFRTRETGVIPTSPNVTFTVSP